MLGKGGSFGADELFPAFVYAVLQTNPPRLYSNLQYVQRWRNPLSLKSEAGCYFTHLQALHTPNPHPNPNPTPTPTLILILTLTLHTPAGRRLLPR